MPDRKGAATYDPRDPESRAALVLALERARVRLQAVARPRAESAQLSFEEPS